MGRKILTQISNKHIKCRFCRDTGYENTWRLAGKIFTTEDIKKEPQPGLSWMEDGWSCIPWQWSISRRIINGRCAPQRFRGPSSTQRAHGRADSAAWEDEHPRCWALKASRAWCRRTVGLRKQRLYSLKLQRLNLSTLPRPSSEAGIWKKPGSGPLADLGETSWRRE